MTSEAALAFFLDGPMQSWGVSSRFQRRASESFPSKSGVIGLLAAALGIAKNAPDEAELLQPLAQARFSVYRVTAENAPRQVIRLEDFHTVGGGYNPKDPVARLRISHKASGGPSATVITHRTYLTEARFVAVLEAEKDILARCQAALEDPKWGVWFGRKSCLPASPLAPILADSQEAALAMLLEKLAQATTSRWKVQEGREQTDGNTEGAWFQPDEPVSFGQREFRSRSLRRVRPSYESQTKHDL